MKLLIVALITWYAAKLILAFNILALIFMGILLLFAYILIKPAESLAWVLVPVYFLSFFMLHPAGFRFGPVNVFPTDFVLFALVIAAFIRACRDPKPLIDTFKNNGWLSLLIALIVIKIAIGMFTYQDKAVGDARLHLGFFFTMLIVIFLKEERHIKMFLKSILVCSLSLLALALCVLFRIIPNIDPDSRLLPAAAVLLILYMATVIILNRINGDVLKLGNKIYYIGIVLLILVFPLNHRSVWLTSFIIAFLVFFMFRRSRIKVLWLYMFAGLMIIGISVFFSDHPKIALIKTRMLAYYQPEKDVTAKSRLDRWEVELSRLKKNPIFGSPYGSYYGAFLGRSQFLSQPHNAFLNILIKMGAVGLLIYLCFIGWLLRTCLILRKELDPLGNICLGICFVLIAAEQFYCLAYDIDLMVYFGYGLIIALFSYFKKSHLKAEATV